MARTTVTLNSAQNGSIRVIEGELSGPYGRTVRLEAIPSPGYIFDGFIQQVEFVPPPSCGDIEFPIECPPGTRCDYNLQIGTLGAGESSYQCVTITTVTPTPTPTPFVGGGSTPAFCNSDFDCNDPDVVTADPRRCIDGVCTDSPDSLRAT
jgi:hypothetical protein